MRVLLANQNWGKQYIVDNAFLPPTVTFREIHYRQYILSYHSVILLPFSFFVSCFNTPVLLALHLGEVD